MVNKAMHEVQELLQGAIEPQPGDSITTVIINLSLPLILSGNRHCRNAKIFHSCHPEHSEGSRLVCHLR